MRNILGLAVGAALLVGASVTGADAMPVAPATTISDASAVTLVAQGCGPFGHRGPYGGCRPNRGGYGRPGFARPFKRCFVVRNAFRARRVCRY